MHVIEERPHVSKFHKQAMTGAEAHPGQQHFIAGSKEFVKGEDKLSGHPQAVTPHTVGSVALRRIAKLSSSVYCATAMGDPTLFPNVTVLTPTNAVGA